MKTIEVPKKGDGGSNLSLLGRNFLTFGKSGFAFKYSPQRKVKLKTSPETLLHRF